MFVSQFLVSVIAMLFKWHWYFYLMAYNPVLDSTSFLVENPTNVFINYEKITETAEKFAGQGMPMPSWDMPILPDKNYPDLIDFFMTASSINFHYPPDPLTGEKYTVTYKGVPWSGAFGMEASIMRALDNGIDFLDSDYLESLSLEEARRIFTGNSEIPMLRERVIILNDLGEVLNEQYGGSFKNLFKECDYRLFTEDENGLVQRISDEFLGFTDCMRFGNREVIFNKKAQMAPALIYGKMEGSIPIRKEDIENLTVYADYQLPKVLRDIGILSYSDSLAKKVDAGAEIKRGSLEELEIRASTIHAADRLMKQINRINPEADANAMTIDYKLWGMRNLPGGKPHHITRTISY